jgi:site-specific DNA-methyltransferase (adenine-specific)
MINLYNDDCLVILKTMDDNSIDSIVTDPPYGLSFMGKKWDYDVPSQEIFEECLRVLKPGGYLLSFSGSRTYHRMAVRVEDAGFEIRDQLMWLYGSGFPKSLNIGKAVESHQKTGKSDSKTLRQTRMGDDYEPSGQEDYTKGRMFSCSEIEYDGTEQEIKNKWKGWGTALKPAHEPIVMARKPLSEKTVATNVLKHGAGGINIDDSRVAGTPEPTRFNPSEHSHDGWRMNSTGEECAINAEKTSGRFPSNVILSHHPECQCIGVKTVKGNSKPHELHSNTEQYEGWGNITFRKGEMVGHGDEDGNETVDDYICHENCPIKIMDEQSGVSTSFKSDNSYEGIQGSQNIFKGSYGKNTGQLYGDKGGASRFFYCAKTSKNERNLGLDDKNNHPTVKPIKLMKYLQTLVTPKGGTTLDPFMGSGTSGASANIAGFNFIGIEMDEDYFKIAEARINASDDMELNDDDKVIISKPIESSIHDWFE